MGFGGILDNLQKDSKNRIQTHQSSLDRLRAESKLYEEKALTPRTNDFTDVLSGALLQFAPAALGYSLGGRQGAISGLEAGNNSFNTYFKTLDARRLQEQQLAAQRLDRNTREENQLERLLADENNFLRRESVRLERDEEKGKDAEDRARIRADIANQQSAGQKRISGLGELDSNVSPSINEQSYLNAPTEEGAEGSDTLTSTPVGLLATDIVAESLGGVAGDEASRLSARKAFDGKFDKIWEQAYKVASPEQRQQLDSLKAESETTGLSQQKVALSKAELGLEDDQAKKKFYETEGTVNLIEDGKPVTYAVDSSNLRGLSSEEQSRFGAISTSAQKALDRTNEYFDAIKKTTAFGRFVSDTPFQTKRALAVQAYASLIAAGSGGDGKVSPTYLKAAEDLIPRAGDVWDLLSSTKAATRLGASAPLDKKVATVYDGIAKEYKNILKSRYRIDPIKIEEEPSLNNKTVPSLENILSKPIPPKGGGPSATEQIMETFSGAWRGPKEAAEIIGGALPDFRSEGEKDVANKIPFLDRATIKSLAPQDAVRYAKEQLGLKDAKLVNDQVFIGDQPVDPDTVFSISELLKEVAADNPTIFTSMATAPTVVGLAASGAAGGALEQFYKQRADGQEVDPLRVVGEAAFNVATGKLLPDAFKKAFLTPAVKTAKGAGAGLKALKEESGEGFIQQAKKYVSSLTEEQREKRAATTVSAFAKEIGLDPNKLKDVEIRDKLIELMKLDEIQYIVGDAWTEGGIALKLNDLMETVGPRIGSYYEKSDVRIPVAEILEGKAFKELSELSKSRKVIDKEYLAAGNALEQSQKFLLGALGHSDESVAKMMKDKNSFTEFFKEKARILNDPKIQEAAAKGNLKAQLQLKGANEYGTIPVKDLWTLTKSWEQETLKQKAMETTYDSGLKAGLKATSGLRDGITNAIQRAADAGDESAKQLLSDNNIYKNLNEVSDLLLDKLYVEGGKGSFKPSFYLPNVIASKTRRALQMGEKLVNNTPLGRPIQHLGQKAMGLFDESGNLIPREGFAGFPIPDGRAGVVSSRILYPPNHDAELGTGSQFGELPPDPRQLLAPQAPNLDPSAIDPSVLPSQPEPEPFSRDLGEFEANAPQIISQLVPPEFQEQTIRYLESPDLDEKLQGIATIIEFAPRGTFAPSTTGFKSEITIDGKMYLVNPQDRDKHLKDVKRKINTRELPASYLAEQQNLFNQGRWELIPPPEQKQPQKIVVEQPEQDFGVKKKMSNSKDEEVIARVKQDPVDHAIAKIESSLNPKAKNPNSSASGLFQLINSTAKNLGVTDPFDPEQNYNAYLKLKERTKQITGKDDVVSIYAGHYLGETVLRKWMNGEPLTKKQQGHVDYFQKELIPRLNRIYAKISGGLTNV